ncbi:hypothetical protein CYLTODRAFT_387493 [Cylindrobasidium torrendii FP15055 ss-10]|uniref:Autophagy-related protein 27 n=1 Tax=Cylindrobasidium torrendii FP15055 ss-10 TaxID=1314674 RepID=A0A0D7BSA8_9AGAR|nr:hypothetical protein CYLTODRAFT_387493 [Cylindrobasidium torrendii FP15055 ss-10]
MILRCVWPNSLLFLVCVFFSSTPLVLAADNVFNCLITTDSLKFDLTSLGGEHTVQRERETPPSKMVDKVRFDLCGDLKSLSDVSKQDQCPEGTRACLSTTNVKENEKDRIVAVIPIATSSSLQPAYSALSSPKGLELTLNGPKYVDDSAQSLSLTLLCATDASDPTFASYNGSKLSLEWKTPAACGKGNDTDGGGSGGKEEDNPPRERSVGSGIGWFFLVLVLAFVAYFGIGAYYNYSTYGASGKDLIPHRDFWQEVPYMVKDVVSHLCSSVRARRSTRGGYISV